MANDRLGTLLQRPWRDDRLPAGVPGLPTMLSKCERRLLYWLAREYAGVDAAIVDAGCFLGGSTAALLGGLRDRAEEWSGPPIATYDLFRIEAYTIAKFFADDPSVRVGDSFRRRFDANVAGLGGPPVVFEGDIREIGWSGGPIDVLFLDVLKSWEINDAVLRDFFPSLVPGRSVIVHQDYAGGYMPWIPISVELMRDSLTLIDWMEHGTHVYLVERELPVDVMRGGISTLDLATRLELIDRALGRLEGWVRGMVEVAKTALLVEANGVEAGLANLALLAERYAGHGVVLRSVTEVRAGLETNWTYASAPRGTPWTRGLAEARRRFAGVRASLTG